MLTSSDAAASAWTDGFGIVAPDVARYCEVLRPLPDAVQIAMENVAESEHVPLLDADTLTLLSLYARAGRPRRVLEVGTGIGHTTVHLARAVGASGTITSIDPNPLRQEQAHAFLDRAEHDCAVELRLGDPQLMLHRYEPDTWDLVVLTDASNARLDLIDLVTPQIAIDGLLVVPWALRGGRVADAAQAWSGDDVDAELQRTLNRRVATDPRFTDVTLLPVGDGVLLARRCAPR